MSLTVVLKKMEIPDIFMLGEEKALSLLEECLSFLDHFEKESVMH